MMNKLMARPFAIVGVCLGIVIFAFLIRAVDTTRREVTRLKTEIRVIRETSPCTNLTASECAYKLIKALPDSQRREIRISERTLRKLRRQAIKERRQVNQGKPVKGADGQIVTSPLRPGRKPQTTSTHPTPSTTVTIPEQTTTTTRPTPTLPKVPSVPKPAPTPTTIPKVPSVSTPSTPTTPTTPKIGTAPPVTVPCPQTEPTIPCEGR